MCGAGPPAASVKRVPGFCKEAPRKKSHGLFVYLKLHRRRAGWFGSGGRGLYRNGAKRRCFCDFFGGSFSGYSEQIPLLVFYSS